MPWDGESHTGPAKVRRGRPPPGRKQPRSRRDPLLPRWRPRISLPLQLSFDPARPGNRPLPMYIDCKPAFQTEPDSKAREPASACGSRYATNQSRQISMEPPVRSLCYTPAHGSDHHSRCSTAPVWWRRLLYGAWCWILRRRRSQPHPGHRDHLPGLWKRPTRDIRHCATRAQVSLAEGRRGTPTTNPRLSRQGRSPRERRRSPPAASGR